MLVIRDGWTKHFFIVLAQRSDVLRLRLGRDIAAESVRRTRVLHQNGYVDAIRARNIMDPYYRALYRFPLARRDTQLAPEDPQSVKVGIQRPIIDIVDILGLVFVDPLIVLVDDAYRRGRWRRRRLLRLRAAGDHHFRQQRHLATAPNRTGSVRRQPSR